MERGETNSGTDGLINALPIESDKRPLRREIPDFTAIADGLRQVAGEEGVLVIEELHRRLVTAEDVKRLNGYPHQP